MSSRLWFNAREAKTVVEFAGFEALGHYETLGETANCCSVFFPEAAVVVQFHCVRETMVHSLRGPFAEQGLIPRIVHQTHGSPGGKTQRAGMAAGSPLPCSTTLAIKAAAGPSKDGARDGASSTLPLSLPRLAPLRIPIGNADGSSSGTESPNYTLLPPSPKEEPV